MEIVPDMWESASFFGASGVPGAPLWGGDGFGAPNTLSECAGQKSALADTAENIFFVQCAPNYFKECSYSIHNEQALPIMTNRSVGQAKT
jgi:hypothetical protein